MITQESLLRMLNFLAIIFNNVLYGSVANIPSSKFQHAFSCLRAKYFAGNGFVFASSKFLGKLDLYLQ